MIFLGDIACPEDKISLFVDGVNSNPLFDNEIIVYNLEGNLIEDNEQNNTGLHNSPKIVSAFKNSKKVIVSLANNHTYDYPENISKTVEILNCNNIGSFGLYSKDNFYPYEYTDTDTGTEYAFFGHCWKLYTKTNPNTENDIRVVDCDYKIFIDSVAEYKKNHSNTKVFCFMHWNYDMEELPFPMLRKVSRKLIDCGVEAVIGCHSHVPQGIEYYKGKLISYCLGNFYIPSGYFFNGSLSYPQKSKASYFVYLSENDMKPSFNWFLTDTDDKELIIFDKDQSEYLSDLNWDFGKIPMNKYLLFYLKNRKKGFLVPFFNNYSGLFSKLEEFSAILRVRIIKSIKK